jgi:hypothetical protein
MSACRACIQQFLLLDTATDPVCPGCRAAWSYDFLTENLTKSFRNSEYKVHREKVLVDRERARFPETQPHASAYKEATEFMKPFDKELEDIHKQMREHPANIAFINGNNAFRSHINTLSYKGRIEFYKSAEYRRMSHELTLLKMRKSAAFKPMCDRIREIYTITNNHRRLRRTYGFLVEMAEVVERKAFIRKCPANGCEGFLSTALKCGLCGIQACKDCHEQKTDGHVCDPMTVETIKTIAKEAKPCPNCAASISKIDGCDQMWCTQCKTAFSWRTGKIETHIIHNPHYFQWMRETGQTIARNPRDIPCNIPDRIERELYRIEMSTDPHRNTLLECLRHINHHRRIDYTDHCRKLRLLESDVWRRELRVKRMVNDVTEDVWKKTLQKQEKAYHKERAKVQLLDMYTNAAYDIMSQMLDDTPKPYSVIVEELKKLNEFVESENDKIHKAYGTVRINIIPLHL